jgi:hypothetical protein
MNAGNGMLMDRGDRDEKFYRDSQVVYAPFPARK